MMMPQTGLRRGLHSLSGAEASAAQTFKVSIHIWFSKVAMRPLAGLGLSKPGSPSPRSVLLEFHAMCHPGASVAVTHSQDHMFCHDGRYLMTSNV